MVTISHSQLEQWMRCQRAGGFKYTQKIEKILGKDSVPLIIGSAFHEGMSGALWYIHTTSESLLYDDDIIHAAIVAATKYMDDNTIVGKVDPYTKEHDAEYYLMMETVRNTVVKALSFYIPKLGLHNYTIATLDGVPMIEYKFVQPLPNGHEFRGAIDAVLVDIHGNNVIFDWKTTQSIGEYEHFTMDEQLLCYTWVLQERGLDVYDAQYVYMRHILPKPAKMTTKGKPSVGAIHSTWDVWYASLPPEWQAAADVGKYDEFREKHIHPLTDYLQFISIAATSHKINSAVETLCEQANYVAGLLESQDFVARPSKQLCTYCDFKRLCEAYHDGGDVKQILADYYTERKR